MLNESVVTFPDKPDAHVTVLYQVYDRKCSYILWVYNTVATMTKMNVLPSMSEIGSLKKTWSVTAVTTRLIQPEMVRAIAPKRFRTSEMTRPYKVRKTICQVHK